MEISLDSYRHLTLVCGYIRGIDYPEESAARFGLNCRYAVVVDTFNELETDQDYDEGFFLALFSALFACVPNDLLEIEIDDTGQVWSWAEFAARYEGLSAEDREPFCRARLGRNGKVVCLVNTYFYKSTGGPPPYSDSYTFGLFSEANEYQECFRSACYGVAHQFVGTVIAELPGLPAPQISLWDRIRSFLRVHW